MLVCPHWPVVERGLLIWSSEHILTTRRCSWSRMHLWLFSFSYFSFSPTGQCLLVLESCLIVWYRRDMLVRLYAITTYVSLAPNSQCLIAYGVSLTTLQIAWYYPFLMVALRTERFWSARWHLSMSDWSKIFWVKISIIVSQCLIGLKFSGSLPGNYQKKTARSQCTWYFLAYLAGNKISLNKKNTISYFMGTVKQVLKLVI